LSQTRWRIIYNSLSGKMLQIIHQDERNKKIMPIVFYNHFFAFVIKFLPFRWVIIFFTSRNKNILLRPVCNQNLTGITKKSGDPAEKQIFRPYRKKDAF